jgi:hypothetical protein
MSSRWHHGNTRWGRTAVRAHGRAPTAGGPRELWLVIALLLFAIWPLVAQAPERALVELQLGRLVSRTVPAYRSGDTALVPFREFLELAEMRVEHHRNGVIATLIQPGNIPLTLDPVTRTLRNGRSERRLSDTDLVVADGELFVATALLASVFNLEWAVSWPDLQVAVLEPEQLPIARRVRREGFLRSRLAQSETPLTSAYHLGLERRQVNGLILDYSVLTPTTSMVDGGAYTTALGLDVFGGSFGFALQSQDGAGRAPRADVSWTGVWRENAYLSQLQLGDAISSGPRSRNVRGFSITNSPYNRPSTLGILPFGGSLGPGWTVEAYRGGRLVGYDSVNVLGQYSFDLPVQYGENPVDFVAYGPFGEIREFNRTYRARTDGIAPGKVEYGFSGGECRTNRCSASGNVDLRYGLDPRWTVRAGMDQFWRDSLGSISHPYLGLIGAVGNAVTLEGEAVGNAVLRGAVRFEPSINLQLGLEANHFATGVRDPILTPQDRLNQYTATAFFRPVSALGATYFDASIDFIRNRNSNLTSGRLGASFQAGEVRVLPALRWQHDDAIGAEQTQTFYGVNTFVLPQPWLGPVLGQLTARTTFELEQGHGVGTAGGYIGMPFLKGLRGELGATWYRGSPGATLSLLIAAELPSVRSYTTLTAGGGLPAQGTQYVQGSAIYNPARSAVDFTPGPSLQRGGVTGRVFLDENGNGKFDRGEAPLAGVRVVVGPVFTVSDSNGAYRVWDMLPYEPTQVAVDSSSLASPLWVPAFAAATVEMSPNRYRKLDIPVVPGGVVEGRVLWGNGGTGEQPDPSVAREENRDSLAAPVLPTAGVVLVFTHKQSGDRRLVTTFSDGTFYVMGVRPGDWTVTVDAGCLGVLKAQSQPVKFAMAADLEGASVQGVAVELR